MTDIEIRLMSGHDPLTIGFLRMFYSILPEIGNKLKKQKIIISNDEDCDIFINNVDLRNKAAKASIVFMNDAAECKRYYENAYYFPYINNAYFDNILLRDRFLYSNVEKKFKCAAIFNTTGYHRDKLVKYLPNFCDIIIIDGNVIKSEIAVDNIREETYKIFYQSEFVVCPPGCVLETYRYTEALVCNAIPLESKGFSPLRFYQHPEKYSLDVDNIDKITFDNLPNYNLEDLENMQKYYKEDFLKSYLIESMRKEGFFDE